MRFWMVLIGVLCGLVSPALSQPAAGPAGQPRTVKVVALERAPYVYRGPSGPAGSAVDALTQVATLNNWRLEWVFVPTQGLATAALLRDSADIAIGALTLTLDRSLTLDYSDIFQAVSLSAMSLKDQGEDSNIVTVMRSVASSSVLSLFGVGIGIILASAVVIRLIERGRNDGMFPPVYRHNIWWSAQTMVAHNCGGNVPHSQVGRLVAMALMIGGTVFTAQMTALLANDLARNIKASGKVSGPADFASHVIATIPDTEAQRWLTDNLIPLKPYATLDDAIAALKRNEAAAVVYDRLALRNFLDKNPTAGLVFVGPSFDEHQHAIFLQKKSPLTEPLNQALRTMMRSGDLDRIGVRWFGIPFHEGLTPIDQR
jgi:ABC-type amino acid transport substrate-binding protein